MTNELCDRIIYDLDSYARDVDSFAYGLPVYSSPIQLEAMRQVIRNAFDTTASREEEKILNAMADQDAQSLGEFFKEVGFQLMDDDQPRPSGKPIDIRDAIAEQRRKHGN